MRDFLIFIGILLVAVILALVVFSYARATTIKEFSQWECTEYPMLEMPIKYRDTDLRVFIFKKDYCVAMVTTQYGQILCYGYFSKNRLTIFDEDDEEFNVGDKLKGVTYYALITCEFPI